MNTFTPDHKELARIRRLAGTYNMIPNLLWSILHLSPAAIFCFRYMPTLWIYSGLGVCFLLGLLPKAFFNRLQLGSNTGIYKKIGIGVARRYAQDGDLVNKLIRKRFPAYRIMESRTSMQAYIGRTYFYERFHFMVLTFMLFLSVCALLQHRPGWGLLMILNNVLYNLYPMFLQQYNRLRLLQAMKRREA